MATKKKIGKIKTAISRLEEITSAFKDDDFKQISRLGLSQLTVKDLSAERFKQVEVISFRKKHRKDDEDNKPIYSIKGDGKNYYIETGPLYVGFININISQKKVLSLEIESGYGRYFFRRMLNVANNIYFDNSLGGSSEKQESMSDMQTILEYSFLASLKRAFVMGVPSCFKTMKRQGLHVKGKIDIKKYYKRDIFKGNQLTFSKKEHREAQEVVDVIYRALSSISGNVKERILPSYKMYENAFQQQYSGKPVTRRTVDRALKHHALNNPMYSKYKYVLKWAKIILEHKNLVSGEDDSRHISGFLLDISELWEVYVHNLMLNQLAEYKIMAQEDIGIYKNTFFARSMEPDFVIQDNYNNIAVLDTKFKTMNFKYYDVDRSDVYQTHTYGYYYAASMRDKSLKAVSLVYPSRKDPDAINELVDNIFGLDEENVKFAISYLKEGKSYEEIRENEDAFISRVKNLLL